VADEVIAGRYRLEQRVGAGAMSEVWSATDVELDRKVAVKLLAPEADPARFEREARAAAALAHPNICTLYAYGESGGRPYIVLEHLPGGSLEDRLARGGPLPDADTHRITADVAAGLAHAHARGVVHRDLKPANVLFDTEGHAKIADFGIARAAGAPGLTEAGTVLGTAAYISPEQAAGEDATPASDVYAFGVILYRMLTGRLPFEAADAFALAAMHREDEPTPISELRPNAPAQLESVAAAALAKSPADRPRDGSALAAELRRPAPDDTAATQILSSKPTRSRTPLVVLAAAALAAAGVGLAMAVTFAGGGDTTPTGGTSSRAETTAATGATALPATTEEEPPTSAPATTATEVTTAEPSPTTVPVATAPVTTAVPPTTPATTRPVTTSPLTVPETTAPPPPTTVPTETTTLTEPTTSTMPTTSTVVIDTTETTATTTVTAPSTPG
jgi:eukaryotic-like serine/threonine-protein kinase